LIKFNKKNYLYDKVSNRHQTDYGYLALLILISASFVAAQLSGNVGLISRQIAVEAFLEKTGGNELPPSHFP
jgi:hypothetical protein